MFLPNDVIRYANPVRTIRILWIAPDRALAFTFELGPRHSQPRMVALQALADDVLSQRAAAARRPVRAACAARAAVDRNAATFPELSRRAAYRQMLQDFYRGRPPAGLPGFGQFSDWLDKDGAPAPGRRRNAAAVRSARLPWPIRCMRPGVVQCGVPGRDGVFPTFPARRARRS